MVTGGKAGAAAVMAAASLGAVYVYWYHNPPNEFESVKPAYWGALIVGSWVGWTHLGSRLGRGFVNSVLVAVTASAFGLLYFLVLGAIRATWKVYGYSSFQTMMELINYITKKVVEGFFDYMQPDVAIALVFGAVVAGILSEWYHIIWD